MRVINQTKNTLLSSQCLVANNFISRFMGLLGAKDLLIGSGLYIVPCNSIHMFFMKFSLDVVFIDKTCLVVAIYQNIQPWKFTPIIRKAYGVLELPVGTILASQTTVGDSLLLEG